MTPQMSFLINKMLFFHGIVTLEGIFTYFGFSSILHLKIVNCQFTVVSLYCRKKGVWEYKGWKTCWSCSNVANVFFLILLPFFTVFILINKLPNINITRYHCYLGHAYASTVVIYCKNGNFLTLEASFGHFCNNFDICFKLWW